MDAKKHILILGGDGYLGWTAAMHFSALGYDVTAADNYCRSGARHGTGSAAGGYALRKRTLRWRPICAPFLNRRAMKS